MADECKQCITLTRELERSRQLHDATCFTRPLIENLRAQIVVLEQRVAELEALEKKVLNHEVMW